MSASKNRESPKTGRVTLSRDAAPPWVGISADPGVAAPEPESEAPSFRYIDTETGTFPRVSDETEIRAPVEHASLGKVSRLR